MDIIMQIAKKDSFPNTVIYFQCSCYSHNWYEIDGFMQVITCATTGAF